MNARMDAYYEQLVDRKIVGIAEDPGEGFVGLRLDNGTLVWVLCDPEGNGPGWLDIVRKEDQ